MERVLINPDNGESAVLTITKEQSNLLDYLVRNDFLPYATTVEWLTEDQFADLTKDE